jgi:hypothetical protein
MMGRRSGDQASLFYEFRLDDRIPKNHLLRGIDAFVTAAAHQGHAREVHRLCSRARREVGLALLWQISFKVYSAQIMSRRQVQAGATRARARLTKFRRVSSFARALAGTRIP